MIKFWTHRYELNPWTTIGALADRGLRSGALLKCQWPNGNVGYSDIFPWPELGDAPLDSQIKDLERGVLSPLMEQAIWLAKKDALLRKENKNAFAGAPKIKNHFIVNDFTKFSDADMKQVRSLGFTTLKIKVGRSMEEEAKFIVRMVRQNPVMVRLDFNGKTNFAEFERFFSHFDLPEKARIEFVEDPVPWDLQEWAEAAKIVPVALDNEYDKVDWEKFASKPPFQFLVLKPARQDVEKALKWVHKFALKFAFTSSLDHPVGVAHALALAGELKKFYPNTLIDCGCLSLSAYRPDEFSTQIQTVGPFLREIRGTGIGFNDLLERVEWTPVRR
jgi:O-succinylbenzoate synthase